MKQTLRTLWDRATETIETIKKDRKYKALQLQAEQDIVKSSAKMIEAEELLEKAIMTQKDSDKPSFIEIVEANENVKITKKRFEIATETFEEFFGEKPKYI
jgi:hypothetical protein